MTTSTLSRTDHQPDGPPRKSSTGGLVGWSLRHRTLAIAGWVLLVLLCVLGGNLAGTVKATPVQLMSGEAGRAAAMVTAAGLDGHDVESVLMTAGSGGRLPEASLGAGSPVVADLTATLRAVPGVSDVGTAVVSRDRSAVLLPVTLADDVMDPNALLAGVSTAAERHPDLHLGVSGPLTIGADVDNQLAGDFSAALIRSLPITIVILLLVFGALLAAGLPLLLGVSSVLSAVGLYAAASHVLPDGGTGAEMILLIGMAVGVDYSLFYLKRAREERRSGRSGLQALTTAGATAGRAVLTSGCAVMVAMAGLFLLRDINFASMALGAIIVVALAVLGSLTVLPAVLGLLGDKVDRPRIPLLSRLTMSGRPARVWPMLLRPAMKFPALTLLVGVVGMLVLAWPATTLHLKDSSAADLPQNLPSVAAHQRITTAFPGERSGLNVVLKGAPAKTEQISRQVRSAIENSATFGPHPAIRSAGDTVVISIAVPFDDDSPQARAALETMRSTVLPDASAGVVGVESAVGGSIAATVDYLDELSAGAPWVIAFVVFMTFLLMTWVFRSVVVGLVTILANLLSAGAAFGVLALVFQSDWGAAFLGFHKSGGVIAWIPVFLFVILFGLSMDYHVLVISRIREAADRGLPIRDAIRDGVSGSASVITSAAAVMIGVFAIFAGLHMVEFKELGVGLAVAVFLDAIVVRILILPALMSLLGNVNWWAPSLLRRKNLRSRSEPTTRLSRDRSIEAE
jgi:RND superfamily putative drug exporter